jgi:hypothetical protein
MHIWFEKMVFCGLGEVAANGLRSGWMWTGTSVEKADQPAESTQGTIQIPG